MNTFFTSDTHFGHARIITLCDRPWQNVDDMNEALVTRWNAVVNPDDVVYHLGDVALGPWVNWDAVLKRLNGMKVLVIGNHDRLHRSNKQSHRDRFLPIYNQWFHEIYHNHTVHLSNGMLVNLSHFPYEGDSPDGDRLTKDRLPDLGRTLIHGHTHRKDQKVTFSAKGTPQVHVGMDAWEYTPVHEDEVIALLEGAGA